MKFLRLLLNLLALAIALAALLLAVALIPAVQTWIANMALSGQTAAPCSVGSLSAGFGKVEAEDLRLKVAGVDLTVPSLTAELPLTTALVQRRIRVRSLVAKGWTLDMSRPPAVNGEGEQVAVAQGTAGAFGGILAKLAMPGDIALDGVDLEGDVLVPLAAGRAPARIHVLITGGGMAAGREGAFTVAASSAVVDPDSSVMTLACHGRLDITLNSRRNASRIALKGNLALNGGPFPEGLDLSADTVVARAAGEETYSIRLNRGDRQMADILARFSEATGRLAGTWKLDARDTDISPFAPDHPLPRIAATGDGLFDADAAFSRVHARGRLSLAMGNLGVLSPSLDRLGAVRLDARFDATQSGHALQMDSLNLSLAGARPVLVLQSLQPFGLDEGTGNLKPAHAGHDWARILISGLPLAWLQDPDDRFTLSGGDLAGGFLVRPDKGGFSILPTMPLTATGASLQRDGRAIAQNLDMSLYLRGDFNPQGWEFEMAPLTVGSGGHRLATLQGKASRPAGPDQLISITGTGSADIRGQSASADFSGTVGTSSAFDAKVAVAGREPHYSLTASLHADANGEGTISFLAPITIGAGPVASDLSAEGELIQDDEGSRIDLRLNGQNVMLDHLRLLGASLAAAGGATPGVGRDRVPFWGDWTGRVTVGFNRLTAGNQVLADVDGAFQLNPGLLRLEDGRGRFASGAVAKAQGFIAFDSAAANPYDLKATASIDRIEAGAFFPATEHGAPPDIDGRFAIAGTATGKGSNLDDLIGRSREEFQLTSTDGVMRVLKTDVSEAIPQAHESAGDVLGSVGSVVGSIFGVKKNSEKADINPVTPAADAVINFTIEMSEIGFDQITLTAVREPGGALRLLNIVMSAPDERFTGSGEISHAEGLPLRERPLSVDLQLWAHGRIAKLLSTAGLLSARKDDQGYAMLNQPIHLGGTLGHIDTKEWHELLVQAVKRSSPAGKKAP